MRKRKNIISVVSVYDGTMDAREVFKELILQKKMREKTNVCFAFCDDREYNEGASDGHFPPDRAGEGL